MHREDGPAYVPGRSRFRADQQAQILLVRERDPTVRTMSPYSGVPLCLRRCRTGYGGVMFLGHAVLQHPANESVFAEAF